MRIKLKPLALLPLASLAAFVQADLGVGDKAPDLKVASYVKGKPVNLAKGIHVVEFWATWCGPCKQSIPHLTEMAKKYKGKADFTGVSVWENGDDQLGQVKKFVADMGPTMDYNVAFDGDQKFMTDKWMAEAKQNGIPAAFLVKDGKVVWIGHPMDGLDEAVAGVISGTFDEKAAKEKFDKDMALRAEEAKQAKERAAIFQPYVDAAKAGDTEGALKALDSIEAAKPELKAQITMMRFNLYVRAGDPRVLDAAKAIVSGELKDQAMMLNQMAWSIVDPQAKVKNPNYEAAVILAQRAAEATEMKEWMILDTYGLTLFKAGQKDKAIEIQTKAVELGKADKNADAATLKEVTERLEQFKKG